MRRDLDVRKANVAIVVYGLILLDFLAQGGEKSRLHEFCCSCAKGRCACRSISSCASMLNRDRLERNCGDWLGLMCEQHTVTQELPAFPYRLFGRKQCEFRDVVRLRQMAQNDI